MPDKSRSPNHQDAIVVDRLLRQLRPQDNHRAGSPVRPRPRTASSTVRGALATAPITLPSPVVVWGRAALGAVLAGAMTQWPYAYCGLSLAAYFVAVVMVLVTGVWAANDAWRARMGRAHVLAIGIVFVGLVLGANQLLPRMGYGGLDAAWRCLG